MDPLDRPQIPPAQGRRLTMASIRLMVEDFLEGNLHTSQSGAVLQNLINACHVQGLPYRLKADAAEGERPSFFTMERLKEEPAGFAPTAGATAKVRELVRSGAAYEIVYVPGSGLSVAEAPKHGSPELEAVEPTGPSGPR